MTLIFVPARGARSGAMPFAVAPGVSELQIWGHRPNWGRGGAQEGSRGIQLQTASPRHQPPGGENFMRVLWNYARSLRSGTGHRSAKAFPGHLGLPAGAEHPEDKLGGCARWRAERLCRMPARDAKGHLGSGIAPPLRLRYCPAPFPKLSSASGSGCALPGGRLARCLGSLCPGAHPWASSERPAASGVCQHFPKRPIYNLR